MSFPCFQDIYEHCKHCCDFLDFIVNQHKIINYCTLACITRIQMLYVRVIWWRGHKDVAPTKLRHWWRSALDRERDDSKASWRRNGRSARTHPQAIQDLHMQPPASTLHVHWHCTHTSHVYIVHMCHIYTACTSHVYAAQLSQVYTAQLFQVYTARQSQVHNVHMSQIYTVNQFQNYTVHVPRLNSTYASSLQCTSLQMFTMYICPWVTMYLWPLLWNHSILGVNKTFCWSRRKNSHVVHYQWLKHGLNFCACNDSVNIFYTVRRKPSNMTDWRLWQHEVVWNLQ